jgi:hypothetical protein
MERLHAYIAWPGSNLASCGEVFLSLMLAKLLDLRLGDPG